MQQDTHKSRHGRFVWLFVCCTPCLLPFTQLPQLIPNRCISGEAGKKKKIPFFNSFAAELQLRHHSLPSALVTQTALGRFTSSPHTCLVWGNIHRKQDLSGRAVPLSCDQPLRACPPVAFQASTGQGCLHPCGTSSRAPLWDPSRDESIPTGMRASSQPG